ncbi:MAG: hypothetical protein IRY88_17420, partial [Rubrobacteraceae bacterium]|nr:hypothetical protein [Rubrobacteraceae bacterium]
MDAYCSSNALLDMNKSSGKFKIKKSEGAILMLSIVFVSIFIPYLVGVNFVVQIASIFPLLIVGLVILPLLYRSPRVLIRRRLGNPKYILLALVLPMPSLIVAVISGVWYAIGYTFLMIAVLTVCQLVLALLPLSSILEAYTRAGVVIILGVMLLNLNGVISSATTASRFSPEYLHPNLLGFIFATFVVVFVWKTINHDARYTTRIFYGVFAILALAIIFLASSRASLLAVFCAVIGAWMIRFTRNLRGRRLFVRRSIPVLLLAAVAGLVFLVESTRILDHAGYLTNLLQIQSSYRGVGSGFSGRIPRWEITISAISQNGLWALGEGYRTGDYNLGFSID